MVVQRRWCGPSIVGLTLARRLPLGPAPRSVTTLVLTHTNGVHAATGVTQIYPETSEAPKGVELQQDVREFYALCPKRGLDKSTGVQESDKISSKLSKVTLLRMRRGEGSTTQGNCQRKSWRHLGLTKRKWVHLKSAT